MESNEIPFSHPHDHFKYLHLAVIPGTYFVLMPFDSKFTIVYETIVRALDGLMTCNRADDLPISSSVPERIVSRIRSAELVIADLTGRNPNAFYEVGLTHLHQECSFVDTEYRGCSLRVAGPFLPQVFGRFN